MPISEASTAPLKNTKAALGIENSESFEANVYMMTQDQCLDNVHPAASNNHFTNDKVSDDLNKSKNSIVSNGVNNVQEFNVDVNSKRSEHSANEAVVQNFDVDANSPPAGKVLTTSEHTAAVSSVFVDSKENSNNLVIAIDVHKSECAKNNILPDMTVITHQNSSENIRDIIASSDQVNKIPSDSQLTGVGNDLNSGKNQLNGNVVNKSGAVKKRLNLRRSKHAISEDKPEDPVERLNKLRASISNALSEVKGVLKQYSTEQSLDEENESTPSSQAKDDGPVRFRFVRKIRRRSVFSEEDDAYVPQNETENDVSKNSDSHLSAADSKQEGVSADSTIAGQPRGNQMPEISKDISTISSACNQDVKAEEGNDSAGKLNEPILEIPKSTQVITEKGIIDENIIQAISSSQVDVNQSQIETANTITTALQPSVVKLTDIEQIKQIETSKEVINNYTEETAPNLDSTEAQNELKSSVAPVKANSVKTKKVLKKDRRASIAAVEINQVLTEKSTPQLDLKSQRRPSDSGTLVKQPARVKVKTSEKAKLPLQRHVKTSPATKTKVPVSSAPSQLIQAGKEDEKKTTPEDLQVPIQKDSTIHTATSDEIPNTLSTQHPLNADAAIVIVTVGTIIKPIAQDQASHSVKANAAETDKSTIEKPVAQDQSNYSVKANVPDTEKSTKVKPVAQVQSNQSTKANVSEAEKSTTEKPVAQKQSNHTVKANVPDTDKSTTAKPVAQDLSNQSAKANVTEADKTTTEKPVAQDQSNHPSKASVPETVKSTIEIQIQDPSNQSAKTNVPETNKIQVEHKSSTSLIKTKTESDSVVEQTAVIETTTSNKGQLKQTPEIPVAPTTIESVQVNVDGELPKDAVTDDATQTPVLLKQQIDAPTMWFEEEDTSTSTDQQTPEVPPESQKKKRKAKRKVVIRRIKRKLSKDDTFIQIQEAPSELEICEKEIEEKDLDEEPEDDAEIVPKQRKSCLKARQFEIGDVVMYAERFRKTQVKWRKATVIDRITSISYKLDIEGEEKPAHISYIKKFTDRKVNFGGKEYLEIDYAQIEEDEEKERNYSIWNLA